MTLLDRVQSPEDIRDFSRDELKQLVREVRDRHIDVVSQLGGHFGASLGVAELTVVLHHLYETPRDKLVWDTGHQGYIHKILTGRNDQLPTIRQYQGLAPFLRRDESEYDVFGAGHAATSISAAWGIAVGRDLTGQNFHVLGVIGDGAMGCGLAYEALNNAGHTGRNFVVVLNDNDMSIAPNVGALNKYLTSVITNPAYNRVRDQVKELIHKTPSSVSNLVETVAGKLEESVKHMFTPGMLFEALGFRYVGPVDGHDVDALLNAFSGVKEMHGPILVHVITQKGKGYVPAEEDPFKWHASSPFDKVTGDRKKKSGGLPRYQAVFGKGLAELGRKDPRIAVITAGMPDGTSTEIFGKEFPERFFDVGIAEGHGATFAAGMATEGVRPVVAIYSTFLQRAFDSIVHDAALQDLPVVFCMDRAGIAGEDGPTHHGTFDIPYMLLVPGMTVTAPKDGAEMLALLRTGVDHTDGPFSLRWPRDAVPTEVPHVDEIPGVEYGTWEVLREGDDVAILAVGTMVLEAVEAANALAAVGVSTTVVNCRFLKPYDADVLRSVATGHGHVLTVEEGAVTNGFGAMISRVINEMELDEKPELQTLGLPDQFIQHGARSILLEGLGLTADGIRTRVLNFVGKALTATSLQSRESA